MILRKGLKCTKKRTYKYFKVLKIKFKVQKVCILQMQRQNFYILGTVFERG